MRARHPRGAGQAEPQHQDDGQAEGRGPAKPPPREPEIEPHPVNHRSKLRIDAPFAPNWTSPQASVAGVKWPWACVHPGSLSRLWAGLACATAVAIGALVSAQSQPAAPVTAPTGAVTGACHVSPIVNDLDRAARFYHDLLGLDLVPAPPSGPLPWDEDPGHLHLHGLPQARLRFIGARMPGIRCGVELVEINGVAAHRGPPADAGSRRGHAHPAGARYRRRLHQAQGRWRPRGDHGRRAAGDECHQQDPRGHRAGPRRPLRRAGPARSAAGHNRAVIEQRHRHPPARHGRRHGRHAALLP